MHLDTLIIKKIRSIKSLIPVVITVDLHAYINEELMSYCDAIVAWEIYPHRDTYTTGNRAAMLLIEITKNKQKLYMSFSGVPVITSAVRVSTEFSGPFSDIMNSLKQMGKKDKNILSTSLFLCQPYLGQKKWKVEH